MKEINDLSLKDAAKQYIEMGFKVVPKIPNTRAFRFSNKTGQEGCKNRPFETEDQVKNHWQNYPDDNIAIITQDIFIRDIDVKNGKDGSHFVKGSMKTLSQWSIHGGLHQFFKNIVGDLNINLGNGIEYLSGDLSLMVAPSVVDGRQYKWANDEDIQAPDGEILLEIDNAKKSKSKGSVDAHEEIEEGSRNDDLCKIIGKAVATGGTYSQNLKFALTYNERYCNPPKSEEEIEAMVKSFFGNDRAERSGEGITADELMNKEFKKLKWAVPDVIPEGLTILAGKPKTGKSMMVLGTTVAVACGGLAFCAFAAEKGDALYIALEDGHRRLQSRLQSILPDGTAPSNLHLYIDWPRSNEGGLEKIKQFIQDHSETRLIVIDTWAKFRPARGGAAKDIYDTDYNDVSVIKRIADEHRISIVIVHHQRKSGAEDVFDTVSGSTGLTGAADTALILSKKKRGNNDAVLHVTGRDVEEQDLALSFDTKIASWRYVGKEEDREISESRQQILELLSEAERPLSPQQIATALNKDRTAVQHLLKRMQFDDQVQKMSYGKYTKTYLADTTEDVEEQDIDLNFNTEEVL